MPSMPPSIALSGTDQHPRDEAPAVERRDVAVLGVLVVGPACDVGHDVWWERRVRAGLELRAGQRQVLAHARQATQIDLKLEIAEVPRRVHRDHL